MNRIILASASPRRKELLERAGIVFDILPGGGEESITSRDPQEAVISLACQKARATASGLEAEEGTCVIGADTIVVYRDEILGKPADEQDAFETLMKLQDQTHQVYTGVCVLQKKQQDWERLSFAACTDVTFYPVTEEEIRAYIRTKEPMDKAGSYGIQGGFGIYVKEIRGEYSNVVGLPVARLLYETKKAGIDLRRM
ncbi:MAG: Maf family protein [Blautia sp.]|nr:Maf family protein [Blautia sp.]MDY5031570.1 Maf family protein [Blautia sp.]